MQIGVGPMTGLPGAKGIAGGPDMAEDGAAGGFRTVLANELVNEIRSRQDPGEDPLAQALVALFTQGTPQLPAAVGGMPMGSAGGNAVIPVLVDQGCLPGGYLPHHTANGGDPSTAGAGRTGINLVRETLVSKAMGLMQPGADPVTAGGDRFLTQEAAGLRPMLYEQQGILGVSPRLTNDLGSGQGASLAGGGREGLAGKTDAPANGHAVIPAGTPASQPQQGVSNLSMPFAQPAAAAEGTAIQQLVQAMKFTASRGGGVVEVKLKPEALGRASLSVTVLDGVVTAHLRVENPQVAQAMESNLAQLKQNLLEQGLRFDGLQVEVGGGFADRQENRGQQRGEFPWQPVTGPEVPVAQSIGQSPGNPYEVYRLNTLA